MYLCILLYSKFLERLSDINAKILIIIEKVQRAVQMKQQNINSILTF